MTETIDDGLSSVPSPRAATEAMGGLTWPYVDRRGQERRTTRMRDLSQAELETAWPRWDGNPPAHRASARVWLRRYVAALVLTDVLAGTIGAAVATASRPWQHAGVGTVLAHQGIALIPFVWLVCLRLANAYDAHQLGTGFEEFKRVVRAGMAMLAFFAIGSYFLHAEVSRGYVLTVTPIATVVTGLGRYVARRVLHSLRRTGRCVQRVVGVGHESQLLHLHEQFQREPWDGLQLIAACVPGGKARGVLAEAGVPVLGTTREVADVVALMDADAVAVTSCPEMSGSGLRRVAWQLENTDVELLVAPGLAEVAGPRIHMRPVAGLSLLHVEQPQLSGIGAFTKVVVDRLLASLALIVLSPVFAAITLAIRLTSEGPAMFRQTRVGINGREFTVFKFRSMYVDAEARLAELDAQNEHDGVLFKIRNDPRVTRVGSWLRRYSLDELPQLWNVLIGDMSLVGPRPPLPREVARYEDHVHRRLLVKPGVTGLWQVSGRADLTWEESVRLDLRYVENWSLALDLMILWKTVFAVVRGSGAY